MKYSIKNEEIEIYNESGSFSFPKYTSQLINWANQNAQGTRPVVVGQMSDLFQEFLESDEEKTIDGWRRWYTHRYPDAFDKATAKIWIQINNLRTAIQLIDKDMVEKWVEDLVINKTFNGLYVQKAILASLAKKKGTTYPLLQKKKVKVLMATLEMSPILLNRTLIKQWGVYLKPLT